MHICSKTPICTINHVALHFLHIFTLIPHEHMKYMMQETNFFSTPLSQAVTQHVYTSVSHSLTLRLSVCLSAANTICHCRLCAYESVWPSICSIRQSIPLVFDS